MIALLLLSALSAPTDTVSGKVTDAAGQPIRFAIVEVAESGAQVTTDSSGRFRLLLAPGGGHYTIIVRHYGFAPAVRDVAVGGGNPVALDFFLTPNPFSLEPVTVTATRRPLATAAPSLPHDALAGCEPRPA